MLNFITTDCRLLCTVCSSTRGSLHLPKLAHPQMKHVFLYNSSKSYFNGQNIHPLRTRSISSEADLSSAEMTHSFCRLLKGVGQFWLKGSSWHELTLSMIGQSGWSAFEIEIVNELTVAGKFLISSHTMHPFLEGDCREVHFVVEPTFIWTYIPECSRGKVASK